MEVFAIEVVENAIRIMDGFCETSFEKVILASLKDYLKYRHLEEQGLLHKAPLKDGTPIWYVLNIFDEVMYVTNTTYLFGVTEYEIGEFGKKFWLSESEAEKALEEMENGNG